MEKFSQAILNKENWEIVIYYQQYQRFQNFHLLSKESFKLLKLARIRIMGSGFSSMDFGNVSF